jgi:hypothetical protein
MIHGYQVYLLSYLMRCLSNDDQIIRSYSKYTLVIRLLDFMVRKHSKYWVATPGMGNKRALRKTVYRDLLAWDRKQCRLVTGLLAGHCTLRWHLHIMGLLDNTICRKYGQKEESSYHILCHCPALARHRMKIFSSAVAEPTVISRASIKHVLALLPRIGPFRMALVETGAQRIQFWSECLG